MPYNYAAASERLNPYSAADGSFKTSSWTRPAFLILLLVPILAILDLILMFPIFIFSAMLYTGWFYTLFVLVWLFRSWRKSLQESTKNVSEVVKSFGLFRQKTSMLLNIVLTASAITLPFAAISESFLYFIGSLIGTSAFTLIIVNSKWIFNKEIRASEWSAVKTRTGNWKLVMFNLFFSVAVWVIGSLALPIYNLIGWSF